MRQDDLLTKKAHWRKHMGSIGNWSAWLAEGDEPEKLEIIRRNMEKGLPCGADKFIQKLERMMGRALQYRPRGRPRKDADEETG